MAYPTGTEILAMLPFGGASVTVAQADAFVADWVELVREAAPPVDNADGTPATTPETAFSRRLVRRGAWGDTRKLQWVLDGHIGEPEDATLALTEAEEWLEQYDSENSAEGESVPSARLTPLPWYSSRPERSGLYPLRDGWSSESPFGDPVGNPEGLSSSSPIFTQGTP